MLKKEKRGKEMKTNGSYFYLIPSGVLTHDKLTDGAKMTYALILGLSNQYGYCFATNESLSELRGVSESTLRRHLKELVDTEMIKAEYNHRNDRRIIPVIIPTSYEKMSQNRKNGVFREDWARVDNALDEIWQSFKRK